MLKLKKREFKKLRLEISTLWEDMASLLPSSPEFKELFDTVTKHAKEHNLALIVRQVPHKEYMLVEDLFHTSALLKMSGEDTKAKRKEIEAYELMFELMVESFEGVEFDGSVLDAVTMYFEQAELGISTLIPRLAKKILELQKTDASDFLSLKPSEKGSTTSLPRKRSAKTKNEPSASK